MEEIYNKHYIRVDGRDRIVRGFSDAFEHPQGDDIMHNGQGGRHFQLRIRTDSGGVFSEENPALHDEYGVPLYTWDGEYAVLRTSEELEADRPEPQATDPGGAWDEPRMKRLEMLVDELLDEGAEFPAEEQRAFVRGVMRGAGVRRLVGDD
jgi:hypothetical protein